MAIGAVRLDLAGRYLAARPSSAPSRRADRIGSWCRGGSTDSRRGPLPGPARHLAAGNPWPMDRSGAFSERIWETGQAAVDTKISPGAAARYGLRELRLRNAGVAQDKARPNRREPLHPAASRVWAVMCHPTRRRHRLVLRACSRAAGLRLKWLQTVEARKRRICSQDDEMPPRFGPAQGWLGDIRV